MENFIYGQANIAYNVNKEGWVTDYNIYINRMPNLWQCEESIKQDGLNQFLKNRHFTEDALINIINDLITEDGFNCYDIYNTMFIDKRSSQFTKNIYNLLKSINNEDMVEFVKQYVYYGDIDKEILYEFKNDIIENINYLKISKEDFYNCMIPFLNENIDVFNEITLKFFLYNNMHNFDFDYDEIKRLLPSFQDDYIIYLTNNMPKTIANSVLENTMINNTLDGCICSAYFSKNPDNIYIANNVDNIISRYGIRNIKYCSFIFERFAYQPDYAFKELFKTYKNNKIISGEKSGDILIYERYVNLMDINSISLNDIQLCFDDKIFECHKRLSKIEFMYMNEIECMQNTKENIYSNVFTIENRKNIIDSVDSTINSIKEEFEKDKNECLDILKNDQDYFLIDKKIKNYEFNKCKLCSQKFEEGINVFYTKDNSYEKQCSLKEFLEEFFNIEINSKKKSYIPENIVKAFTESLFRGKITDNKGCSYTLKIDIDLSKEDLIEDILSYRISADNKKYLSEEKTLQVFLLLN